jgi:hypothetical protein
MLAGIKHLTHSGLTMTSINEGERQIVIKKNPELSDDITIR